MRGGGRRCRSLDPQDELVETAPHAAEVGFRLQRSFHLDGLAFTARGVRNPPFLLLPDRVTDREDLRA